MRKNTPLSEHAVPKYMTPHFPILVDTAGTVVSCGVRLIFYGSKSSLFMRSCKCFTCIFYFHNAIIHRKKKTNIYTICLIQYLVPKWRKKKDFLYGIRLLKCEIFDLVQIYHPQRLS